MSRKTNRLVHAALMISAMSLGLMLAGCETFDPTDLTNMFDTKKKLPGDRKPVFPDGTPGVPQGVPADLVKGYQPPAEPVAAPAPTQSATAEPEKPKPKPKPKPKLVAKPAEPSRPGITIRPTAQPSESPAGAPQWPDPPQAQTQQPQQSTGGGGWSGQQSGSVDARWPDPPPAR
jgi:outer membrane biosynthesis protein TonB